MRHARFELVRYKNQQLMDELNEFMICCKVYLFGVPISKPKPTVKEMDELMNKLMRVLEESQEPFIKY